MAMSRCEEMIEGDDGCFLLAFLQNNPGPVLIMFNCFTVMTMFYTPGKNFYRSVYNMNLERNALCQIGVLPFHFNLAECKLT